MNEKGKNPNSREYTNSTNVLDVERSNVALERSNIRVHSPLSQKPEVLNVRTLLSYVRMFSALGQFMILLHCFCFISFGDLWYCVWDFIWI